ncbi:MAG: LuxR C-terminal-related transcriptional regulator [Amaricoccus sp.]|uniref:response regulator transcription factor n=1 Tax=Amaricoccus sp. TaxID=1872485 RepID=UPI003314E69C
MQNEILSCTHVDQIARSVLDPIAHFVGAESSVYLHFRGAEHDNRLVRYIYQGPRPDAPEAYRNRLYDLDPVVRPSLDRTCHVDSFEETETGILSIHEGIRASRYYQVFLHPFDLGSMVVLTIPIGAPAARDLICLGFHRSLNSRAFAPTERHALAAVAAAARAALGVIYYRDAAIGKASKIAIPGSGMQGPAWHYGRRLGLTEREVEVLHALTTGRTNLNIAHALNISIRTVENHLRSIYSKANVNSRTQILSRILAKD